MPPSEPIPAFYWTDADESLLSSWSPETGEIKRLYYGDPDLPSGKQYWEFGIASWLPNGRIFLSTNDTPFATPQGIGVSVHPSLEVTDLTVWERSSPQSINYAAYGGVHEPVSDLFWLNWVAESSDPKHAWSGFDTDGNLVRQECEYTRFSNFVPDQEGNSGAMFTHGGWVYRPLVQESYIERFNPATLQWQWTAVTNASRTVVPTGYSEAHGIICVDNVSNPGKFYAWHPDSLNWGDMPDGAFAPGDSRTVDPAHEWTASGALVNDTRWGVATVLNGHVYYGVSGTYGTDFGKDGSGALWGASTTVWDLDLATGVSQVLFEIPYVAIDVHGNVVPGGDPTTETEVWSGAIGLLYVGGSVEPVPVIELAPPSARRRFTRSRGRW